MLKVVLMLFSLTVAVYPCKMPHCCTCPSGQWCPEPWYPECCNGFKIHRNKGQVIIFDKKFKLFAQIQFCRIRI